MICPLMSQRVDYFNAECNKEKCAWWIDEDPQDTRKGICAIKRIAKKLAHGKGVV